MRMEQVPPPHLSPYLTHISPISPISRTEQMLAEAEGRYAATDEVHAKHFGWVLRQYRAHPGYSARVRVRVRVGLGLG